MPPESYPFQSSDDERRRLVAQSELIAPLTQRLLERAGVRPGMRVLDIGSGPGDVAFSVARLVGPEGSVIGVDRDPEQIAFAERRARADRLTNVRFLAEDFRGVDLDPQVDAIVGRLVLMYASDPLDALRRVVRNLKPGGVIALQESIIDYDGAVLIEPADCLAADAARWFRAGFRHAGVHARMGLRLPGMMRSAGLNPSIEVETLMPILQGPDGALFSALTSAVRSQLPAIVASGAVTEAEIDIETLERRMVADARGRDVVGYFNLGHLGAWARKP